MAKKKKHEPFGIDWRALYLAQDGRCFYCHRPIQPTRQSRKNKPGWTCDHVVPRVEGGIKPGNSVISCASCNSKKGQRMPTAYELERFDFLMKHYDLIKTRGALGASA